MLAQSLGLVVWRYKAFGFSIAAGVSGLAGFALVNMLLTAHPTSFSPLSSVDYIAYAIIGGKGSMLGPVVGGALGVGRGDIFAARRIFPVPVRLSDRRSGVGHATASLGRSNASLCASALAVKPSLNNPARLNTSSLNAPTLRVPVTTEPQR